MRIKRHFSVIGHSPDEVELRYGVWNPISHLIRDTTGSGKLFLLLKSLAAGRAAADIVRELDLTRTDVEAMIDRLNGLGVMEQKGENLIDEYLDRMVPSLKGGPAEPATRVLVLGENESVNDIRELLGRVIGPERVDQACSGNEAWDALCDPDRGWLHDALAFAAKAERFEEWRGRFLVLVQEEIDPLVAIALNRIAIDLDISWIHAALDGPFLLVGPIFSPQFPCYECFEKRVTMNLRQMTSYIRYKNALVEKRVLGARFAAEPVLRSLLVSHTVFEALNYLLTGSSFTLGKVFSIYLPTMEFAYNEVLKLPGCSSCAPVPFRDERETYFDIAALLRQE